MLDCKSQVNGMLGCSKAMLGICTKMTSHDRIKSIYAYNTQEKVDNYECKMRRTK